MDSLSLFFFYSDSLFKSEHNLLWHLVPSKMGLSVSDEKIENIMNEEMIGSGVYYLCLMNCPTLTLYEFQ